MAVSFGDYSSHWYIKTDGFNADPFYQVPYADPSKGMRKANITDARKVGARPSVTSVQKIEAKEAIVRYRIENALMSALTSPIQKDIETDEQYVQRIIDDAQDESKRAMDLGSEIHQQIFNHYENKDYDSKYDQYVLPLTKLVEEQGIDIFKQEKSFCNGLYGCRIDANGWSTNINMPVIVDWKSQKTKRTKGKFTPYPEHGEQLAAEAYCIEQPSAILINFYTSSDEPGNVNFHIWKDNEQLFKNFMLVYKLWCIRNNYEAKI
jgi:hypothetical protein